LIFVIFPFYKKVYWLTYLYYVEYVILQDKRFCNQQDYKYVNIDVVVTQTTCQNIFYVLDYSIFAVLK